MTFQRKNPAAIGVKEAFPGFIEPELATSVDKVPIGERWDSRDQVRRLPRSGRARPWQSLRRSGCRRSPVVRMVMVSDRTFKGSQQERL
jgi:hypothetical protein